MPLLWAVLRGVVAIGARIAGSSAVRAAASSAVARSVGGAARYAVSSAGRSAIAAGLRTAGSAAARSLARSATAPYLLSRGAAGVAKATYVAARSIPAGTVGNLARGTLRGAELYGWYSLGSSILDGDDDADIREREG